MYKSQLITTLSEENNITIQQAEVVVHAFIDTIEKGLANGERTEIRGLGSFQTKKHTAYLGRNPKTGSSVKVPAKTRPFFKMGRHLKQMLETQED
jgi:integration host factor subunit beta